MWGCGEIEAKSRQSAQLEHGDVEERWRGVELDRVSDKLGPLAWGAACRMQAGRSCACPALASFTRRGPGYSDRVVRTQS